MTTEPVAYALLRAAERSAVHMELRDAYTPGEEKCDDPAVAKLCAASFDAAWERAIPHEAYQPA